MAEGFRPPENNAEIRFEEGHEYHGMTLTLSLDVGADKMFAMIETSDKAAEDTKDRKANDALPEDERMELTPRLSQGDLRRMYEEFGDMALVEWNVEDKHGEPVPATGEGLLTQSFTFIAFILKQWVEATSVDAPLEDDSQSSPTSLVEFAKTEAS